MGRTEGDRLAWPALVSDPESDRLTRLMAQLAERDGEADEAGTWPAGLWQLVAEAEAPLWSMPEEFGGQPCDRATLVARYARLAEGSLTAAFILTQHDAS